MLDELARACEKYYGLVPPIFQERNYPDVRAAFIATPVVHIDLDFEQLLVHKNNNTLLNVHLAECRDPSNFGALNTFRKQLADFLLNLSRHQDDPVVSVSKKLENRSDAAHACVTRVEDVLLLSDPNLVSLRCLNDKLSNLYKFYTEQSSYVKWGLPNFVITAPDMTKLREKLLTKIDEAQSVRSQIKDEHKKINRAFLESKSLPKISVKTWQKFLRVWQLESPNFRNPEARINALRNSVTNKLDKQAVDAAQSEAKIMDFLELALL